METIYGRVNRAHYFETIFFSCEMRQHEYAVVTTHNKFTFSLPLFMQDSLAHIRDTRSNVNDDVHGDNAVKAAKAACGRAQVISTSAAKKKKDLDSVALM